MSFSIKEDQIRVALVMGSISDYETVIETVKVLESFGIAYEKNVIINVLTIMIKEPIQEAWGLFTCSSDILCSS